MFSSKTLRPNPKKGTGVIKIGLENRKSKPEEPGTSLPRKKKAKTTSFISLSGDSSDLLVCETHRRGRSEEDDICGSLSLVRSEEIDEAKYSIGTDTIYCGYHTGISRTVFLRSSWLFTKRDV